MTTLSGPGSRGSAISLSRIGASGPLKAFGVFFDSIVVIA
jgi:hypothetical protein